MRTVHRSWPRKKHDRLSSKRLGDGLIQPLCWESALRDFAGGNLWWIWPILGIVFLPWTTITYVLVAPGESIGSCGPTGAGRSAILNILTRSCEVNSGTILIDGQNLCQLTGIGLRKQIGAILQPDVVLVFVNGPSLSPPAAMLSGAG